MLQRHCGCCCCSCGGGGEPWRSPSARISELCWMAVEWQSRVFVMSVRGTRHVPFPSPLSLLLAHSRRAPLCRYLASTTRQASAAPNPKHQTASSQDQTPNTTPQSRNPKHQTPNTKHQTLLIPSVHPVQDCTWLCCWGRRRCRWCLWLPLGSTGNLSALCVCRWCVAFPSNSLLSLPLLQP